MTEIASMSEAELATSGGQALRRALRELGTLGVDCDRNIAAKVVAAAVCAAIVDRRVDPYEGAVALWRLHSEIPALRELLPFVGAASEIEDDPRSADVYAEAIYQAAQRLRDRAASCDSGASCRDRE